MIHGAREAYEVEFSTFSGLTVALATLPEDGVRAVGQREIAHVRDVA